jgi:hypothetical protein
VTAGEDQPEPIVDQRHLLVPSHSFERGERRVRDGFGGLLGIAAQRLGLLEQRSPAAEAVDRPVPSRCRDPRARIAWNALRRPGLERADERLLDRFLGEVEVAENADERRDRPTRFLAEQAIDEFVRLR